MLLDMPIKPFDDNWQEELISLVIRTANLHAEAEELSARKARRDAIRADAKRATLRAAAKKKAKTTKPEEPNPWPEVQM